MADGTSREVVRIGVLGAAMITPQALCKPAAAEPRVEVVAVAARSKDRASAFAAKHGIPRVLDDYDAVIDDPDIDAVYNPLPNALHARWTIRALEAGKHVLAEKPLTDTKEQAEQVAAAAAAAERVVLEAFHYRYHPSMARAVEILRSGELGAVRHAEAWMQIPLIKPGDIRYQYDLGGGAVMDLGCYTIHQLRTLTGEEPTVRAATAKERATGVDRWMRADLAFPSGATGRFTVSLYGAVPLRLAYRVRCERGELGVTNPTMPQLAHRFVVRTEAGTRKESFPKATTYGCQLAAFAAAVLDGEPVLTPPADSIANMAVIDDVYRAAGLPLRP